LVKILGIHCFPLLGVFRPFSAVIGILAVFGLFCQEGNEKKMKKLIFLTGAQRHEEKREEFNRRGAVCSLFLP
jgi:hypothetical protein